MRTEDTPSLRHQLINWLFTPLFLLLLLLHFHIQLAMPFYHQFIRQ